MTVRSFLKARLRISGVIQIAGLSARTPVARGGGDDFSVRPFDYLATWDRSGELGFGTIAGAWPEPGRTSLLGLPPTRSLRRPPHDVLGGAGIEIVQLAVS